MFKCDEESIVSCLSRTACVWKLQKHVSSAKAYTSECQCHVSLLTRVVVQLHCAMWVGAT